MLEMVISRFPIDGCHRTPGRSSQRASVEAPSNGRVAEGVGHGHEGPSLREARQRHGTDGASAPNSLTGPKYRILPPRVWSPAENELAWRKLTM